jgi:hypothetical protein
VELIAFIHSLKENINGFIYEKNGAWAERRNFFILVLANIGKIACEVLKNIPLSVFFQKSHLHSFGGLLFPTFKLKLQCFPTKKVDK